MIRRKSSLPKAASRSASVLLLPGVRLHVPLCAVNGVQAALRVVPATGPQLLQSGGTHYSIGMSQLG